VCLFPNNCKVSDTAMALSEVHKKISDGSFAVCSSIAFATGPSSCCGLIFVPITLVLKCEQIFLVQQIVYVLCFLQVALDHRKVFVCVIDNFQVVAILQLFVKNRDRVFMISHLPAYVSGVEHVSG